jgi:hypothetical protein
VTATTCAPTSTATRLTSPVRPLSTRSCADTGVPLVGSQTMVADVALTLCSCSWSVGDVGATVGSALGSAVGSAVVGASVGASDG